MFSLLETVLIVTAVLIIMLPPKHDPAIMLKEWFERRRHRNAQDRVKEDPKL